MGEGATLAQNHTQEYFRDDDNEFSYSVFYEDNGN